MYFDNFGNFNFDSGIGTPVSSYFFKSPLRLADNIPIRFGASNDFSIGYSSTNDQFVITDSNQVNTEQRLVIDRTGNVGIGTITPTSLFHVDGPIATAISSKTADYTITSTDSTILADGTSNVVTITLPTTSGIIGRVYVIKCIDDTFQVDVATNGVEEIDGDSGNFVLSKYEVITIQTNGTDWFII